MFVRVLHSKTQMPRCTNHCVGGDIYKKREKELEEAKRSKLDLGELRFK